MIIVPQEPIRVIRPEDSPSEHDKFKDDGKWFFDKARFISYNYYNRYAIPTSFTQPLNGTATKSAAGNPLTNGYVSTSIVDEMLDNYNYYYGNQDNKIFNHLSKGVNNNTLPNVWIKGQEVRSLIDHIGGKGEEIIEPIEDNISCETISENTLLKRQEIFDKIDLAAQIGDALNGMGGGIQYNPAGNIDYSDPSKVKEAKDKVKGEYETTATVIGRNAYYTNRLSEKFKNVVYDTAICNLAGIEFFEKSGKLESNYIPGYQAIYDFSTWGEFGEGQMVGGYIVPMDLSEVLGEYPDLEPQARKEIEDVLYNGVEQASAFMDYYNQPFTNVRWWYNDRKWISKAVVYWLAECDTRYAEKSYPSGLKKTFRIDDYKDYYEENYNKFTDSALPKGAQKKKGYELKGNSKVWKVHKAVILGNKYLVEYGYDTYQVRPFGDKQRPALPVHFFCQGKMAGYVKSIVSRIKPKQDELDAVRYRIREYASNDLGVNLMINGTKLTEDLKALDIVNDFRSMHVTVIPSTGDAEIDKRGMSDIITTFASNAAAAIKDYLILKADILKEMRDILNIPETSLGMQQGTIGKSVQEETIARSELSGLPLFNSLNEYFRRVIQYASNKNKMILLDGENKNVILPISAREVKLLKLTKDFQYEDLFTFLNPNDKIKVNEMGVLRQMLQSYGQQPTLENAEAMINALHIMDKRSFREGITLFEEYVERKKKENEQAALRQATTEQQAAANQQQSTQILAMQEQMAKLLTDLAKIEATGAWNVKNTEVKAGYDRQFQYDDAIIQQITGLVSKQLQSTAQPPQQEAQAA